MGIEIQLVDAGDFAGELIGLQMGLNFAAFCDPLSGGQSTATANFFGTTVAFLFIVINGHLLVIAAVVQSFHVFPVGAEPLAFAGHDSWVFALNFTDGGQSLLTGGGDGALIWWPAADPAPKPARTIQAHDGWLRAIALAPDGHAIATAGNDRVVRLWSSSGEKSSRPIAFAPSRQARPRRRWRSNAASRPSSSSRPSATLSPATSGTDGVNGASSLPCAFAVRAQSK